MKAFALTVTTLYLATLAQGYVDYQLKCDRDEIGIRWPSYYSNSDYYMCNRIGGKQIKLSCDAGELFTFVLQSCTTPGRFIPPPPLDILPTHATLKQLQQQQEPEQNQVIELPKPIYASVNQPPVPLSPLLMPPNHVLEHTQGDKIINELGEYSASKEQESALVAMPALPVKPSPHKKPPGSAVTVPLPPTPEPTPPVVKKQPGKKAPSDNNKAVKKPQGPPKKNTQAAPPQKSVKPPKKPTPPAQA